MGMVALQPSRATLEKKKKKNWLMGRHAEASVGVRDGLMTEGQSDMDCQNFCRERTRKSPIPLLTGFSLDPAWEPCTYSMSSVSCLLQCIVCAQPHFESQPDICA